MTRDTTPKPYCIGELHHCWRPKDNPSASATKWTCEFCNAVLYIEKSKEKKHAT